MLESIMSSVGFWLVLYCSYKLYFAAERHLFERAHGKSLMPTILSWAGLVPVTFAVLFVSHWHLVEPAKVKTKEQFYGAPITGVDNLEGKMFTPQAFVITAQHILVYDKNGKVYSLDGIHLDGMRPEQLVVAEDISYTVYRKGDKLFFGKL